MKPGSAASSAVGAAFARAVESCRPERERLFDDPLASALLPPAYRALFELMRLPGVGAALLAVTERQTPGVLGSLLFRTRYIDDALRDALGEGLDQVAILGAGLDTRPYRIPVAAGTRFFEVDHPATQALKQARLRKVLGALPPHVTFVPIDFDQQRLEDAMAAASFRTGGRTFFICEGVTQYITAEAVDATLRYVSSSARPGSRIVFTYIRLGVVDGTDRSAADLKVVSRVRRIGEPWVFGLDADELPHYLVERGLDLVEQVGASEAQARYLAPLGRRMKVYEGERIALGRVAGAHS